MTTSTSPPPWLGGRSPKPTSIEGRLRGIRKRVWGRLNGNFVSLNPDVGEALEALFRRPLTRDAERRLKSALATRADDDDLADLLALLNRDNRLVIRDTIGSDPIRIVCTMGVNAVSTRLDYVNRGDISAYSARSSAGIGQTSLLQ